MHVVIVGAGVTGLMTAWHLQQDGHEVTVMDGNAGPGESTSYANGGQLSYSYVAPLAGPGVLHKIPLWLFGSDSPLHFSPQWDWGQWRWLAQFILACNTTQSNTTTERLLRLAFYSRDLLHQFLASESGQSIRFGHAHPGKLVVFSDTKSFDGAKRLLDFQRRLGCEQFALGAQACSDLEPALADPASRLGQRMVGGIHTPSEEVGDCHAFCVGLTQVLKSQGVAFQFGNSVQRLVIQSNSSGQVAALHATQGELGGDAYVLCAGNATAQLAAKVGINLPIYPLKGYSLTLNANAMAPRLNITDSERKVVYASLDSPQLHATRVLRIAGLADIVGHDTAIDPKRFTVLRNEAKNAFPNAAAGPDFDSSVLSRWAGLRPATPRGAPLIGPTRLRNLYVNSGHGALGWTLASGSGRIVADLISGQKPAISLVGFGI